MMMREEEKDRRKTTKKYRGRREEGRGIKERVKK